MFNRLDRYVARQVIVSSLMMLFMLTLLRSLFSLIDELGDLDKGAYQLSDALIFVSLMLPARLLEFFPMSVLIGALFGLGNLAANSELTAMRAVGITTWRIAGSTIKGSIVLMVCVIVIGEWIAPNATKSAQQLRTAATSSGELSLSKSGLWARDGNQMIHLGNRLSAERLRDITIYSLSDDYRLVSILKADSARRDGALWKLESVEETLFYADKVVTNTAKDRTWSNPLQEEQIESLALEPEAMNLSALFSYIEYLKQNNLQTQIYELAVWRKVVQPLAIAVMMFLAASFIFGPMRDVSMGARILSGVMLGFGFHLANQSFGPVSLVFNLPPFLGAVLPVLLFGLLGYWLMKRQG